MTAEERAALLRLSAAMLELRAARLRLSAAAVISAEAFADLGRAWTAAEIREVQSHPDLAELDVMLNGFYDQS